MCLTVTRSECEEYLSIIDFGCIAAVKIEWENEIERNVKLLDWYWQCHTHSLTHCFGLCDDREKKNDRKRQKKRKRQSKTSEWVYVWEIQSERCVCVLLSLLLSFCSLIRPVLSPLRFLVKLANKLNAHAWHSPSGMEFVFDLMCSIRIRTIRH